MDLSNINVGAFHSTVNHEYGLGLTHEACRRTVKEGFEKTRLSSVAQYLVLCKLLGLDPYEALQSITNNKIP